MHRGFNYYYREGLKVSAGAVYGNKCFFKYLLYFIAEFFGRILIIFNPHFNLANIRQGYVVRKANRLDFSSSFRNVGGRVSIWTYILTLCFELLIILAGLAAFAVLGAILGGIGYGVGLLASFDRLWLFAAMFAAPAAPLALLYVLVTLLIFSPTAYIMANNKGVSAGETIGACYKTMLTRGKSTVFLTYFVSMLIRSLYFGAVGAGGYFLLKLFIPENYFTVTLIAWVILSLFGYLAFAPVLTLTNRVVKEHLFEDVVLDPAAAARINEKVNLSVCNGVKTSQNLAALFEYAEDPYRILEETEKKRGLLEQKAVKQKPDARKEKAAVGEYRKQTN